MKFTIMMPVEIQVSAVRLVLPIRYGEEDIPKDFPMRFEAGGWTNVFTDRKNIDKYDAFIVVVDIDTGQIRDWPKQDGPVSVEMKVCDEGIYILYDETGKQIAKIEEDYVPHGVCPGQYGDYVDLQISATGLITNWPKKPNVQKFFDE